MKHGDGPLTEDQIKFYKKLGQKLERKWRNIAANACNKKRSDGQACEICLESCFNSFHNEYQYELRNLNKFQYDQVGDYLEVQDAINKLIKETQKD